MSKFTFLQSLPNRYRRITTDGNYEGAIDGLRWLAISSVIVCHINSMLQNHATLTIHYTFLEAAIYNLLHGVQIFFALSGYILTNAFFKRRNEGKVINLKAYYLRRLTRLEPAYFIVLLFSFVVLVFVTNKYTFAALLPHLGLSMLYASNFFYPAAHPLVFPIAWSLEVEVQFYVILPILFWFYTRNLVASRIIGLLFVAAMPLIISKQPWCVHTTYIFQAPYFFVGILLADITNNCTQILKKIQIKPILSNILALMAWIGTLSYTWVETRLADGSRLDVQPIFIFILLFMVLTQGAFKSLFSNKWVCFIGGACYSIYLTHFIIISVLAKILLKYTFSTDFLVNFIFLSIFIVPVVLFGGLLFYITIERPTMRKDWWRSKVGEK